MKINAETVCHHMERRGISKLELCRRVDITPSLLGVYLHAGDAPDDVAVPMAEILGITTGEIGETLPKFPNDYERELKQVTRLNVEMIYQLMSCKGMGVSDLARLMGIWPGLLENMLGRGTVTVFYAKQIADTLNVPIVEITMAA